jgi:micrococcal nuclease
VKYKRFPAILFVLFCSLLLNGYLIIQRLPIQQTYNRVESVIDGDTVLLTSGERVRLLGIDAPEAGRCYFDAAKQRLTELVLDKYILIKEERPDNFGRRMGLVYLDGMLINTVMIEEGYAKPDYTKNSMGELFIKAYDDAKKEQLGVNSDVCKKISSDSPPDPNCTIKGNIDKATGDKFFHYPGCRQYTQIVLDLNTEEGYFCSEEEAIKAGFMKASGCN